MGNHKHKPAKKKKNKNKKKSVTVPEAVKDKNKKEEEYLPDGSEDDADEEESEPEEVDVDNKEEADDEAEEDMVESEEEAEDEEAEGIPYAEEDSELENQIKKNGKRRARDHRKGSQIDYRTHDSIPETCQDEWKTLQDYLIQEEPSLEKILGAPVERKTKAKMYRLFQRYKNTESQEEEDTVRAEINDLLEKQSTTKEEIQKQDQYKEQEHKLLALGNRTGNLKLKILHLPVSDTEKSILYQRYMRLEACPPLDSEKGKLTEWLYYAIQIPRTLHPSFERLSNPQSRMEAIQKAKTGMDTSLYGMETAKEQILVTFFDMIAHPSTIGHSIGLVGPKGVGKTILAQTLANALSLPFQQISLGGINDASFLDGSSLVFEGSQPGIITKKLIKMGHKNGILFFDELDKLAGTEHGKEVSNSLLHITDFSQNHAFTDKYIGELDIDLSHLFFIFSMNDPSLIDPILLNRIPLIYVPGYSLDQKLYIIQNYLLPKELSVRDFASHDLIFPPKVIQYMITKHHLERYEGVRELQELISDLVKKLSLYRAYVSSSSPCLSSSSPCLPPASKKRKLDLETSSLNLSFSFMDPSHPLSFPLTLTNTLIDLFLPVKH